MTAAVIADPVAAVLAACQRYRNVREQPVASNRSPEIDYWLEAAGVPVGLPWCAAFVSQVGREALGEAWPVLRSASVQQIVDWAKTRGLALEERPTAGALMVVYYPAPLNRYGHIGIVAAVAADGSWTSWEGNTRVAGDPAAKGLSEREGYRVALQARKPSSRIRFIDWALLLQKAA